MTPRDALLPRLHREIAAAHATLARLHEQLAAASMPNLPEMVPEADRDDPAAARRWYGERVNRLIAAGERSSRERNYQDAKAAGWPQGCQFWREVRAELAPAAWQESGRPSRSTAAGTAIVLPQGDDG